MQHEILPTERAAWCPSTIRSANLLACRTIYSSATVSSDQSCRNNEDPLLHNNCYRAEAHDPGHWGTWITKTGWTYEGPSVDNHFDKDYILGVYRVTSPVGEASVWCSRTRGGARRRYTVARLSHRLVSLETMVPADVTSSLLLRDVALPYRRRHLNAVW